MNTFNETSIGQRTRSTTDSVHQGIDRAAEALHDTAENAAASATKLADSADRGVENLRAKQEQARAKTLDYATQHPLRSIAIGVGVGFVLAKLFGGHKVH